IEEIGVGRIRENSLRQTQLLIELADAAGVEGRSPRDAAPRGGTVTVGGPGFPARHPRPNEPQILCGFRPPSGTRLRPHYFTTDEELRFAVAQIEDILVTGAHEQYVGAVARH